MKRLRILPLAHPMKTRVEVPGSKSYTIRALLLAAMTPGRVKITGPLACDDTDAMIGCLETLGIKVSRKPSYIEVAGDISAVADQDYELDAGLSGITLRFLLALSCVIPGRQSLRGQAGLNERPVGKMVDSLRSLGADIEYTDKDGYPPVIVRSSVLTGGGVKLAGDESSQYLSALLMIAPVIGGLNIEVTGKPKSKPYADMTVGIMKDFGVAVAVKDRSYEIVAGQEYRAAGYEVEGDVSGASYFFAVAALTRSTITVGNLNPDSLQADMGFLKILEDMGSAVTRGEDAITVAGGGVKPLKADMGSCPDQAQTLAVLAAFAGGKTVISGVSSLRIKETERVKALENELAKMGVKATSSEDVLSVQGGEPRPASIDTYGDHRMAMAFAVAGSKLAGMEIRDPEVVSKTFPDFWKTLARIGVRTERIHPNIVLIGMRGSGKTTVAKQLAKKLGIKHLDLDEVMADKLSMSTPEIVEKYGWGYFRDRESAIAKEIAGMDNALISTGGGIVLRPDNITALRKNGIIVLLNASVDVMVRRLRDSSGRPPLTDKKTPKAEIEQVLRERQRLYEAAADIIIDTDKLRPDQAANEIILRTGRSSE
jgi:3-phosphoshikimate 1-carboxyvinyltransferase